jgi:hypothetical protein
VDGETPSSTREVFILDSSLIADLGGTLNCIITVDEPGKQSLHYAITLTVARLVSLNGKFILTAANGFTQTTYRVGEEFNKASVEVTGTYSDNTTRIETDYEVAGFDSSVPGPQTVRFRKNGVTSFYSLEMSIVPQSEARLFFWYGGALSSSHIQRNRYTLTQGKTLVIAPVCWRIPGGAAYQWTVSGGNYTSHGEYLTFNSGTPVGTYNVTVGAYSGSTLIAQASTIVECVSPTGSGSVNKEYSNEQIAPGQFVEPNWGTSLGGYGGSAMYPFTTTNGAGDDFRISGNAFGGWVEPGIIWVMKDENHNNAADDTWYELKGNATELGIPVIRRYAVTYYRNRSWEDNLGNTGILGHAQKYRSDWPDAMTLAGTRLDYNFDTTDIPGYMLQGYVDTGDALFDISDAVQADGTPVSLDRIDFVMIQNGIHVYTQIFGEISTEFREGVTAIWTEDRTLTGESTGSGYEYEFINNSGYDLTITFKDLQESVSVPGGGQTRTLIRPESRLYFNYVGGNVNLTISGNTLTFVNG